VHCFGNMKRGVSGANISDLVSNTPNRISRADIEFTGIYNPATHIGKPPVLQDPRQRGGVSRGKTVGTSEGIVSGLL
jgi:hypothetical protein